MTNLIENYIPTFSEEIQEKLYQVKAAIESVAPNAEQAIKYAMPTYVYHGNLVHFAGYKNHIGFYPTPSGLNAFTAEISKYKNSKGAVQFPINESMPLELIKKLSFSECKRMKQNVKAKAKKIKF